MTRTADTVRHGRIVEVKQEGGKSALRFGDGASVFVSNFLTAHIRPGDGIDFPLAIEPAGAGTELYIHKNSRAVRSADIYQAPITARRTSQTSP